MADCTRAGARVPKDFSVSGRVNSIDKPESFVEAWLWADISLRGRAGGADNRRSSGYSFRDVQAGQTVCNVVASALQQASNQTVINRWRYELNVLGCGTVSSRSDSGTRTIGRKGPKRPDHALKQRTKRRVGRDEVGMGGGTRWGECVIESKVEAVP